MVVVENREVARVLPHSSAVVGDCHALERHIVRAVLVVVDVCVQWRRCVCRARMPRQLSVAWVLRVAALRAARG